MTNDYSSRCSEINERGQDFSRQRTGIFYNIFYEMRLIEHI